MATVKEKPFSFIGKYIPKYDLGVSEVQMLVKHNQNMQRVINRMDYKEVAKGQMAHFHVEQSRVQKYLQDISILALDTNQPIFKTA